MTIAKMQGLNLYRTMKDQQRSNGFFGSQIVAHAPERHQISCFSFWPTENVHTHTPKTFQFIGWCVFLFRYDEICRVICWWCWRRYGRFDTSNTIHNLHTGHLSVGFALLNKNAHAYALFLPYVQLFLCWNECLFLFRFVFFFAFFVILNKIWRLVKEKH